MADKWAQFEVPASSAADKWSQFEVKPEVPQKGSAALTAFAKDQMPRPVDLDIATGIAKGTRNLLNLPLSLAGVSPEHQIPEPVDISKRLGLRQDPLGNFTKEAASYIPTALGSEVAAPMNAVRALGPSIAKLATEGFTHGLSENPTHPGQALAEAGANTILPAGMGAGKAIVQAGAEKFGLPGFSQKVADLLKPLMNLRTRDAATLAEQRYNSLDEHADKLWGGVRDTLKEIDKGAPTAGNIAGMKEVGKFAPTKVPEASFDPATYKLGLNSKISEMEASSAKNSADKEAFKGPLKVLRGYANDPIATFEDAINHNISLNKAYKEALRPTTGMPKSQEELAATKVAMAHLHNALDENLARRGLTDTFGPQLQEARGATRDLHQIFNEVPNVGGQGKTSILAQQRGSNSPFTDPTTFIDNYIPTSRQEGSEKLKQLGAVLGNKDTANNYAKARMFKDAIKGGTPDPIAFTRKYDSLSPEIQDYLFTPEQRTQADLVSKLAKKYPERIPSLLSADSLGKGSVGAGLGAVIGGLLGGKPLVGAAIGGAAGTAGTHALYQLAQNPEINKFLQAIAMNRGHNMPPITNTAAMLPRAGAVATGEAYNG